MKKFILISLMFYLISGCEDNTTSNPGLYKTEALIIGYDMRECMCCGGWFIDIDDSTYRFWELPKDCEINFEKDTLPLAVKLDWKKSETPCLGDEIVVLRLKKLLVN